MSYRCPHKLSVSGPESGRRAPRSRRCLASPRDPRRLAASRLLRHPPPLRLPPPCASGRRSLLPPAPHRVAPPTLHRLCLHHPPRRRARTARLCGVRRVILRLAHSAWRSPCFLFFSLFILSIAALLLTLGAIGDVCAFASCRLVCCCVRVLPCPPLGPLCDAAAAGIESRLALTARLRPVLGGRAFFLFLSWRDGYIFVLRRTDSCFTFPHLLPHFSPSHLVRATAANRAISFPTLAPRRFAARAACGLAASALVRLCFYRKEK